MSKTKKNIPLTNTTAKNPAEIVGEFKASLTKNNGRIALFHDVPYTAEALEEIIPWLREQGYTLVPLQELLEPPTFIALTRDLRPGDTDTVHSKEVSLLQWFLYNLPGLLFYL